MKKPLPKREVATSTISKLTRLISMYATQDAIEDFKLFGRAIPVGGDEYYLFVDTRYDFDEVLAYIQSYGNENES